MKSSRDLVPAIDVQVPRLITPTDGGRVDAEYAVFEWTGAVGADAYHFQVAEDEAFERVVADVRVGDATSLTLFESFPADAVARFARVRALRADESERFSPPTRFYSVSSDAMEPDVSSKKTERAVTATTEAAVAPLRTVGAAPVSTPPVSPAEAVRPPYLEGTTPIGTALVFMALVLTGLAILIVSMLL